MGQKSRLVNDAAVEDVPNKLSVEECVTDTGLASHKMNLLHLDQCSRIPRQLKPKPIRELPKLHPEVQMYPKR